MITIDDLDKRYEENWQQLRFLWLNLHNARGEIYTPEKLTLHQDEDVYTKLITTIPQIDPLAKNLSAVRLQQICIDEQRLADTYKGETDDPYQMNTLWLSMVGLYPQSDQALIQQVELALKLNTTLPRIISKPDLKEVTKALRQKPLTTKLSTDIRSGLFITLHFLEDNEAVPKLKSISPEIKREYKKGFDMAKTVSQKVLISQTHPSNKGD